VQAHVVAPTGPAAVRANSPWPMMIFPCRRCAEPSRDLSIPATSHRNEPAAIRQGRARADGRVVSRPRSGGPEADRPALRDARGVQAPLALTAPWAVRGLATVPGSDGSPEARAASQPPQSMDERGPSPGGEANRRKGLSEKALWLDRRAERLSGRLIVQNEAECPKSVQHQVLIE